jgi:hypothetical protein
MTKNRSRMIHARRLENRVDPSSAPTGCPSPETGCSSHSTQPFNSNSLSSGATAALATERRVMTREFAKEQMTPLSQRDVVTTHPPPAMATANDTLDIRWDRWIADGIRHERIFDKRAKVALVALAWAVAIVTIWLVVI